MGKNILRQGGPGAGQHCKMANQIAVAASMLAWVEALAYAGKPGSIRRASWRASAAVRPGAGR